MSLAPPSLPPQPPGERTSAPPMLPPLPGSSHSNSNHHHHGNENHHSTNGSGVDEHDDIANSSNNSTSTSASVNSTTTSTKKKTTLTSSSAVAAAPVSSLWSDSIREMVNQMASTSSAKKVAKQFKLLNKIGSGSFGAVYEARHEPTGCIVAIKCVQGDDDDVQREMHMQQQQQCSNIVAFYGHFEKDSQLWLVMELCAVGAVTDLMRVCQCTLDEQQIAVVVRGALAALHYMHEKKGVHRDIKTDNILLSQTGEPKLGDFGVSRQLGAGETRMRTIAGTPYFIAPEILSSEQPGYNTKADIWSVGISIIEMAQGHPPYFDEHPMRVLFFIPTKPAPVLDVPTDWSADMHDFLSLCLTKDPTDRPGAAELLQHRWITTAPDCTAAFGGLIANYDEVVEEYGSRSKALKAMKKSSDRAEKGDKKKSNKRDDKRDDKRQRRRERREKTRRRNSSDYEGSSSPADNGTPPPLPPDEHHSSAPTSAAPVMTSSAVIAHESDDEHSQASDSEEAEDTIGAAGADEQFVIDYSHGRPLIFDGHREDGRCWFDPRHQVWLRSPDDNPETAKTASDRTVQSTPPAKAPPALPPPTAGSAPPIIAPRSLTSSADPPARLAQMPAGTRTSVGHLLAEKPFKFYLPNGTFKTIVAQSNWSVMQLLAAARDKAGLNDQNIILVLRDPASRVRRVFDARERPLLMAEVDLANMAFYIEAASAEGGSGTSDKRRGLLSEIRGFKLKK